MGSNLQKQVTDKTENSSAPPRSLAFWVMWSGFAVFMMAGWLRMIDSLQDYYWLNLAGVYPGPVYIVVTGWLWGLAGLVAILWLVSGSPGYRIAGWIVALFFALTYWVDRLLFSVSEGGQANLGFAVLATIFCLSFVLLVLRPLDEMRIVWRRVARVEKVRSWLGKPEES